MQAHMPMKKIITILFLIVAMPSLLNAQKVGLVMSGGGARGLAHIGVIKALEENGIPIDYVAGTSMGAIVASLYSMGFTPDEMIAMMSSDDFQRWCSGTMDQEEQGCPGHSQYSFQRKGLITYPQAINTSD